MDFLGTSCSNQTLLSFECQILAQSSGDRFAANCFWKPPVAVPSTYEHDQKCLLGHLSLSESIVQGEANRQ